MKIIENTALIADLFDRFVPDGDQAFATCRCLPAPYEQDDQEWAERGTIDGDPAKVYWIFEADVAKVDDASELPFDAAHVSRIEVAEQDDGGEYDEI